MASPSTEQGNDEPHEGPFRGLRSFSSSDEDAAMFFGRDREVKLIAANLLASRLTLLYGQSGIGKSSILCAGVVHELRAPARSVVAAPRSAVVYVSKWHGDPRAAILDGMTREAERLAGDGRPSSASIGADVPLDEALFRWSERLDAQVLLILDQFEQYFLYHPVDRAQAFDRELADAVVRADLRLRCVISLREDALVGLDRFKGSIPNLFANRLRLDGLTDAAAREAVARPIERYNRQRGDQPAIEPDPELADAVVRGLRGNVSLLARGRGVPRALEQRRSADERVEPAYLQLVMEALWQRERELGSSTLRVSTLEAMGGCEEIVRSHVQRSLDSLPARSRPIAAGAIGYLVTPSGTKIAHTPIDLARYTRFAEERVRETLERLCALRIMRPVAPAEGTREQRFEVFHDLLAGPILDWRARFEAQRLRSRMRWLLASLLASSAAALAIAALAIDPAPLHRLELRTLDARFAVRGTVPADRDIVIVDLDRRSLDALGGGRKTTALRPDYARLFDLLLAGDPKVIADDVEFEASSEHDRQLLSAIRHANGRIVLAAERFDSEGDVALFGQEGFSGARKLLRRLHASAGYDGLPLDPGGVYRRMWRRPPRSRLLSLSVRAAEVADPGSVPPFTGTILIDYHGPPRTFRTVSMLDVLTGRVPPSYFKGKIVLFGTSAPAGEDLRRTSVTDRKTMPGVEIQANAISTVRHGPALREASVAYTILLIVGLSLTPLLAIARRWWLAVAIFAASAGACLVLVQLLFDGGVYIQLVYPLLALALAAVGTLVCQIAIARQSAVRARREAAPLRPAGVED